MLLDDIKVSLVAMMDFKHQGRIFKVKEAEHVTSSLVPSETTAFNDSTHWAWRDPTRSSVHARTVRGC